RARSHGHEALHGRHAPGRHGRHRVARAEGPQAPPRDRAPRVGLVSSAALDTKIRRAVSRNNEAPGNARRAEEARSKDTGYVSSGDPDAPPVRRATRRARSMGGAAADSEHR